MKTVNNNFAWRLNAKDKLRRDVPLTLGMAVFWLPESFDTIDADTVTGLKLGDECSVALSDGDFFAMPEELHVSTVSGFTSATPRFESSAPCASTVVPRRKHGRDGIGAATTRRRETLNRGARRRPVILHAKLFCHAAFCRRRVSFICAEGAAAASDRMARS